MRKNSDNKYEEKPQGLHISYINFCVTNYNP